MSKFFRTMFFLQTVIDYAEAERQQAKRDIFVLERSIMRSQYHLAYLKARLRKLEAIPCPAPH
jgi:hypothetical protein